MCEITVVFILSCCYYVYNASCFFIYPQSTITCSELAVEMLAWCVRWFRGWQWRHQNNASSGVFIVNFGCISYLVQVSMLFGFEQLIADWVSNLIIVFMYVYLMKNKKLQMERKTKNNVLCECICLYSYFSEIKKYVIIAIM